MSLSGGEAPEVLLSTPATTLLLNTLRAVPQTAAVESFLASNYGEAWKDVERSIWSHVAKLGTSENLQQLTQDSKSKYIPPPSPLRCPPFPLLSTFSLAFFFLYGVYRRVQALPRTRIRLVLHPWKF